MQMKGRKGIFRQSMKSKKTFTKMLFLEEGFRPGKYNQEVWSPEQVENSQSPWDFLISGS